MADLNDTEIQDMFADMGSTTDGSSGKTAPVKVDGDTKVPEFDMTPKIEEPEKDDEDGIPEDERGMFNEFSEEPKADNTDEGKGGEDVKVSDPFESDVKTVKYLQESGVIDLDENTEVTPDNAIELLEDGFDKKVDDRIVEIAKGNQAIANFLKAVSRGADPHAYMASVVKRHVGSNDGKTFDPENSVHVETTVRNSLRNQGFEAEMIDSQITHFRDSGKLKDYAITLNKKAQEDILNDEKAETDALESNKRKSKEADRVYKNSITKQLSKGSQILGKTLDIAEQRELTSFMVDKDFELPGGARVSESTVVLYEAMQDPKKAVIVGQLLKSDFNMDNLKKFYESEATKEVTGKSRNSGERKPRYRKLGQDDLI